MTSFPDIFPSKPTLDVFLDPISVSDILSKVQFLNSALTPPKLWAYRNFSTSGPAGNATMDMPPLALDMTAVSEKSGILILSLFSE